MRLSSVSLTTSCLLATIGLVCVGLPVADPLQQAVGSPQNWLLFDHSDEAAHEISPETGQVSREKRQTTSANLMKKKKKPERKGSFEKECLAAHNEWRKLHQAEPLVFDKKIAEFSKKRANFIADSDGDEFKHPPDLEYGENLAWHSRETTSCFDLIKMWYDEVNEYDFNKAKFDHETGHFTQLVWRSTRSVGCAKAISSGPRGGVYLVCNYDPPGNFLGEESENVLPAVGKIVAAPKLPTTITTTTTTTTRAPITSTTKPPTTTTSTTSVAPTSVDADATSGGGSVARKNNNKKNKKTDKSKRKKKKKGNKNKKNKNKRRNKKKTSSTSTTTTTTTTTTTVATPTG